MSNKEVINSISFNSDSSFIGLATSLGFRIYSVSPFSLRLFRDFGTPLQFVELIDRSNLVGIVGSVDTPFTPPNRLAIFDDKTQKIISDLTFQSKIKQLKIRQGKIVVALYNKVFLVDLFSMEIEHIIETFKFEENQIYNLISINNSSSNLILAAPAIENGHVKLIYLKKLTQRKIRAHQSILSAVLLSQNGQKIATTSQKGIQVRIFETRTGHMIQQVRRGNQFGNIYSLAFSPQGNWLAVSSDSCNLHIFVIKPAQSQKENSYVKQTQQSLQNPKSMFFFLKKVFPYFDAEYSYCGHKYEDYSPQMRSILAFTSNGSTILSVNNLEVFQKMEINEKGGKCKTIQKKADILGMQRMFIGSGELKE